MVVARGPSAKMLGGGRLVHMDRGVVYRCGPVVSAVWRILAHSDMKDDDVVAAALQHVDCGDDVRLQRIVRQVIREMLWKGCLSVTDQLGGEWRHRFAPTESEMGLMSEVRKELAPSGVLFAPQLQKTARNLTVCAAVCTLGQSPWLLELLRRLLTEKQEADEVLVIANGRASRNVANGLANSGVRVVACESAGLSKARNVVLSATSRDIISFLDDDVMVDSGYVQAVRASFGDPAVGYMAGRITLASVPPEWIQAGGLMWTLGQLSRGDRPEWLLTGQGAIGANMAVRRAAILTPFREDLGYVGRRQIGGEESAFLASLHSQGWEGVYQPMAWAVHQVDPGRFRWKWQVRRCFWEGVSLSRRRTVRAMMRTLVARAVRAVRSGNVRAGTVHTAEILGLGLGAIGRTPTTVLRTGSDWRRKRW
jgi:hypothetical protein